METSNLSTPILIYRLPSCCFLVWGCGHVIPPSFVTFVWGILRETASYHLPQGAAIILFQHSTHLAAFTG